MGESYGVYPRDVDLSAPITDVIPGHRGVVLAALLRLREPVTGRELAAQAGVPPATARRIIDDLAEAGLVNLRPAGRALGVTLNRQHLAVPALEQLAAMRALLIEQLRSSIAAWGLPAAAAWMFGSAARGNGNRHSDIDLVVVSRGETTDHWETQTGDLASLVRASTGNDVQLLDYPKREFRRLVLAANPLIRSLREDGIELVSGSSTLLRKR
jgi:predicted nucleotidyltransferase